MKHDVNAPRRGNKKNIKNKTYFLTQGPKVPSFFGLGDECVYTEQ